MVSRLNVELHPLENVEILSTIFSFSSVEDLKNYRLVGSKVWLKASLNSWRKKAVLVIDSFDRLRAFQNIYEDEKDPHQLRKKPFQSYKFHGFHNATDEHLELSWILENFSNRIRHLTLDNYNFATNKSFLDTIFIRLPNLAELKLKNRVSFTYFKETNAIPVYPKHQKLKSLIIQLERNSTGMFPSIFSWEEFLKNIPNVKDLRFILPSPTWSGNKEEVRKIMNAVASTSKIRLRTLDLDGFHLEESGFDVEPFMEMPLESIKGKMDSIMLMKPYSETLKFLRTSFTGNSKEDSESKSPVTKKERITLPHLKELHVDGSAQKIFTNLNKIDASSLDALSLNVFSENVQTRSSSLMKLVNPSFKNVTKLEWCKSSSRHPISLVLADLQDLKHLSQAMPNVKHAKMLLTPEAFTELCSAWPNLLTLAISDGYGRFTKIDDETITGIKPGSEVPVGGDTVRLPNITNLKLLTDFEYSGALGDLSVNFGFLQLPRLHYLKVKSKKISEEAKAALRNKVNVLEL